MLTIEELFAGEDIHPLGRDMSEILEETNPEAYKALGRAYERFAASGTLDNVVLLNNVFYDYNVVWLGESWRYEQLVKVTPLLEKNAVRGKSAVLEAGVGHGLRQVFYAANNPLTQFTAIDVNPREIEFAKALAAKYGCKNIDFRVGNICDLDCSEKFDSIIAAHMLHDSSFATRYGGFSGWMDMYAEQLQKLAAAVMRGGIITVTLTPVDEYHMQRETVENAARAFQLAPVDDPALNFDLNLTDDIVEYMTFIKK